MNVKDLRPTLVIPDTHVPFEDRKAYKLMLEVARAIDPYEILFLGDFLDFYNVTSHKKDASIKVDFKYEIDYANEKFDEIDFIFPKAKKTFIEGNHEFRFERYINEKCPELFGVTDWQLLTKMAERRWTVIPYGPEQKYAIQGSALFARHEPNPPSGAVGAVLKQCMASLVFGHIHRICEGYAVNIKEEQFVAWCPGWLGNKHHKVMSYIKGHAQWSLGFGVVWVDPLTKMFYHQKIPILPDYSCMVNGQRFKIR